MAGQPSPEAKIGGAEGSRTPDLFIANEALYQLSYDPNSPMSLPQKSFEARRNAYWLMLNCI